MGNDELSKVLHAEADLAEALLAVVGEKQGAIVRFDGEMLRELTRREEEILRPLRDLEQARAALFAGAPGAGDAPPSLRALTETLAEDQRERIAAPADRLRAASEQIVRANQQNRLLLRHALAYVRETIRLVTDNNRRKLVDQRI